MASAWLSAPRQASTRDGYSWVQSPEDSQWYELPNTMFDPLEGTQQNEAPAAPAAPPTHDGFWNSLRDVHLKDVPLAVGKGVAHPGRSAADLILPAIASGNPVHEIMSGTQAAVASVLPDGSVRDQMLEQNQRLRNPIAGRVEQTVDQAGAKVEGGISDAMSPEFQQQMNKDYVRQDPNAVPVTGSELRNHPIDAGKQLIQNLQRGDFTAATLLGTIAESAPSMAGGMAEGSVLAKGLIGAGRAAAPELGITTAKSLERLDNIMAVVGYGGGEALVAAPIQSAQVRDEVRQLPLNDLLKSPRFREIWDAAADLDPAQRLQYARETMAWEAGTTAGTQDAITTFLTGPIGAQIGMRGARMLMRRAGEQVAEHAASQGVAGALKDIGKAVLEEGAQETLQSGLEGYEQSAAVNSAGGNDDALMNALNQAIGGGITGGLMGGGMGGLHALSERGAHAGTTPPPGATPPPAGAETVTEPGVATPPPPAAAPEAPAAPNAPPASEVGAGAPAATPGPQPTGPDAATLHAAIRDAQAAGVEPRDVQTIFHAVIRKEVTPEQAHQALVQLTAEARARAPAAPATETTPAAASEGANPGSLDAALAHAWDGSESIASREDGTWTNPASGVQHIFSRQPDGSYQIRTVFPNGSGQGSGVVQVSGLLQSIAQSEKIYARQLAEHSAPATTPEVATSPTEQPPPLVDVHPYEGLSPTDRALAERQDEARAGEQALLEPAAAETPAPVTAEQVDAAAHTAATSPLNELDQPTEPQKEAGNYQKGHIKIHGLDVTIENPAGSTRTFTHADGTPGQRSMLDHYGYIRRTEGADSEQVDTFIGPHPESQRVFVIDQTKPDGSFDEHKVMLGYKSKSEAIAAYSRNYQPGWNVGPVKAMSVRQLQEWVKGDNHTTPLNPEHFAKHAAAQAEAAKAAETAPPAAEELAAETPAEPAKPAAEEKPAEPERSAQDQAAHDAFAELEATRFKDKALFKKFKEASAHMEPAARELARYVVEHAAVRHEQQTGKPATVADIVARLGTSGHGDRVESYSAGGGYVIPVQMRSVPGDISVDKVQGVPVAFKFRISDLLKEIDLTPADESAKAEPAAEPKAEPPAEPTPPPAPEPEPTPHPDTPREPTAAEKKAARHTADRDAFASALTLPVVQENAAADNFAELVAPKVNEWVEAQLKDAAGDPLRESALKQLKVALATTAFADKFFKGLQTEAKRAAKQAELDRNRDPAVYQTGLTEAMTAAKVDATDADAATAFRAGWDHALSGKTKSTITGDAMEAKTKGYEAAREWMRTDEGKAWYTGKRGTKLENTGVDLRRWWEKAKGAIDASRQTDVHKAWADIEPQTRRGDLFSPELAEDATPGAHTLLSRYRDQIIPFKEYLKSSGLFTGITYYGDKSSFDDMLDKLAQHGNAERSIPFMQKEAVRYVEFVGKYSEALDGAQNITQLLQQIKTFWDSAKREDRSDFLRGQPTTDPRYFRREIEKENDASAQPERTKPLTAPKLDRVDRTGLPDHRQGKDITPQQFKDTFGLSDVGFGKWVGAKQDQDHINYAYDALLDLAHVFKIDPKAIGLANSNLKSALHVTFGALGSGKSAAHFSPNQSHPNGGSVAVMNFTNTKGDGTVAHEWTHALDHATGGDISQTPAIARLVRILSSRPEDFDAFWEATVKRFLRGHSKWTNSPRSWTPADHARHALQSTYYAGAQKSSYFTEAKRLDSGKEPAYWSNARELLARAVESWVFDTLGEHRSTYLVNPWVADGATTRKGGYRGAPFPEGEERKTFNKAIGQLVAAIKWDGTTPTIPADALQALDPKEQYAAARARAEENFDRWVQEVEDEKKAAEISKDLAAKDKARQQKAEADARAQAAAEAEAARAAAEAAANQPPAPPMGPLSEDDLSKLFDDVIASEQEAGANQPLAPPPGAAIPDTTAEPTPKPKRSKAQKGAIDKTAATMIAEAAKLGVKGIDESLKGLAELFGGNAIKSFPAGMDAEAYAKAKPHFDKALEAFRGAGKNLADLFRFLIQQAGAGIKPYLIHWAKENQLSMDLAPPASPSMKVAEWVNKRLSLGEQIDWTELFDKADESFGGTQSTGQYTSKDAYDAMEAGMNLQLRQQGYLSEPTSAAEATRDIAGLQALTNKLPTQTKRTAEMDEFQQFSTPPAYAYVVNWLANIKAGETVMEPSAGIGGLAVFAENAGAKLVLNELSVRRRGVLQSLFPGARTSGEDASQIHNILPDNVVPSVVVMNPPFSATAGRVEGKRDTMEGAKHIEQALQRLAPGGRLVAIVGEGMAADKPAFRAWWAKIQQQYNVRANLGVDGSGYAKYGTTFDNQILVIDKTGPTQGKPITGKVDDVAEVPKLLEAVRNERVQPAETNQDLEPQSGEQGRGETAAPELPESGEPVSPEPPATGAGIAPPAGIGGPESGRNAGVGQGTSGRRSRRGNGVRGGEPGAGFPGTSGEPAGPADGAGVSGADAVRGDAGPGVTVGSGEREHAGELTDSIFESYTPARVRIAGAQPHKGKLVESAAMGTVDPPAPTYTPNLPKEVVDKGLLSLPQLESVVYAGQAHQQLLDNGERRGYLIGDGTGVGKGREIAGIILDNLRQGRKKAIWISEKNGLANDALRDASDIGLSQGFDSPEKQKRWKVSDAAPGKLQVIRQREHNAADKIGGSTGILFSAYSTLKSGQAKASDQPKPGEAPKPQKQSRLKQLIDWAGPDFDGVLVFDEAHAMANNLAQKGARGQTAVSQQAQTAMELQKALPKARVVYVSATAATEVRNLGYASRLGLWGEGTSFADAKDFVAKIGAAGVSAMELVARDLKAMGRYLARSLSYDGISYSRLTHELTPTQTEAYNRVAQAWQVVLQNINSALETTGANENGLAKGQAMSQFWGAHQRFFNQLITAMQMPSVLEKARADFDAGHSPVFQLVNTNEADQERAAAARETEDTEAGREDEGLEFGPMDSLINFVQKAFPVQQYVESANENGDVKMAPAVDSQGNPIVNREMVAKRDALVRDLKAIAASTAIPGNPIDSILEAFGDQNVAEITGRSRRFVRKVAKDGSYKIEEQKRGPDAIAADSAAFQDGRKRVLIFSNAGGTGFSYHASNRVKNQTLRRHYLVQPGWQADKAVQGFGRTHRTDQKQAPEYILCTTDLKAQKRFMSSIARRLDQLGALTRGERKASSQLFSADDNLESQYAITAQEQFWNDLFRGAIDLGVEAPDEAAHEAGLAHGSASFQALTAQMGLDNLIDEKTGGLNDSKLPDIRRFLNRLFSVNVELQGKVFDAFYDRMQELVQKAVDEGTYDLGLETLRALSTKKVADEVVHEDARSGAATRYVQLDQEHPTALTTFDDVRERADAAGKNLSGFYRDESTGDLFAVIRRGQRVTAEGQTVTKGQRWSVNGAPRFIENVDSIEQGGPKIRREVDAPVYRGESARSFGLHSNDLINIFNDLGEEAARQRAADWWGPDATYPVPDLYAKATTFIDHMTKTATIDKAERLLPRYTKVSDHADSADLEAEWNKAYESAPKTRTETVHMITGVILPIWDRLPGGQSRVGRAQTDDGERLLGRVIAPGQVKETLQKLGVNPYAKLAPDAIMKRVMDGQTAILANGWQLKKVRVSNDDRIEIKGHGGFTGGESKLLLQQGAFHERIQWDDRYFVPTGDSAVLGRITSSKPVHEFVGGKGEALLSRSGEGAQSGMGDTAFAADVVHQLGEANELFKLPPVKEHTLEGALQAADPHLVAMVDQSVDPDQEAGATKKWYVLSGASKEAYIYQRGRDIWIDVSAYSQGEGGDLIYHAVKEYARHNGLNFIGDPRGVSPEATIRRTYHMLSGMVRYGDSKGFEPSQSQRDGIAERGIAPLAWPADNLGRFKALIESFYQTAVHNVPDIQHLSYDFDRRAFVDDRTGAVGSRAMFQRADNARRSGAPAFGSRALRAAVFLRSLASVPVERRSVLLERVLRHPSEYVAGGDLKRLFSRQTDSTAPTSPAQVKGWLAKTIEAVKGAADVHVVENVDQLRAELGDPRIPDDVEGVYVTGGTKVYLVADQLSDAPKAQAKLAHELFGHLAMERYADMAKAIEMVQTMNRMGMKATRALYAEVERTQPGLSDTGKAKEVIALMAERGVKNSVIERMTSAVKALLGRMGFTFKPTEAELRQMIVRAGRALRADATRLSAPDTAIAARAAQAYRAQDAGALGEALASMSIAKTPAIEAMKDATPDQARALERLGEVPEILKKDTYTEDDRAELDQAAADLLVGNEVGVEQAYPELARALDKYENGNDTPRDVLEAVQTLLDDEQAPESLREPTQAYADALDEDFNEHAGRGDTEPEEEAFLNAVRAATGQNLYSRKGSYQEDPDLKARRERIFAGLATQNLPLKDRARLFVKRLTNLSGVSARQYWVDKFASIAAYEKVLNGGQLKDASESMYKRTIATQNLNAVMSSVMSEGVPVWKDGSYQVARDGRKGIFQIFDPIVNHAQGNLLPQWEAYAVARRSSRLIGEQRENLLTQEDIDAFLKYGDEHPEFARAFDEWQTFNKQTLDMAEEAGLIDPAARAIWERNDYVPFYRAMETVAGTVNPVALNKAIANQKAKIRTLKGGESQLLDVFESMLMNTAHLVDASFKNKAAQAIVTELAGVATNRVPMDIEKVSIGVEQVVRALRNAGIETPANLSPDQMEGYLNLFRRVRPTAKNVVTVMFDGKPQYFEILDPLLLQSIVEMHPNELTRQLSQFGFGILPKSKRLLTRTVTSLPGFMIRNFMRDTMSVFVQTKHAAPIPFVDSAKGMLEYLRDDKTVHAMMMSGALQDGFYDNQRGNLKQILLSRMSDDHADTFIKSIISPKKLWHMYERVQQSSEAANRIAVYQAAIAHGATQAEAAYQAHDVLNFQSHGAGVVAQLLNLTVPFLNARIQGLDRLTRGFNENRMGFAAKGAIFTALTLALMALGANDKRYEELDEWDRDTYWHIFTADGGHFRIPKPFEVGSLFGTVPERAIRAMSGSDTGRATAGAIMNLVTNTFAFNPIPQVAKPLVETWANKSFFTGHALLDAQTAAQLPETQYKPWTTASAIAIAHAMPSFAPDFLRSPILLENLVRGYTGTLGMYALQAADGLMRAGGGYPDAPSKPWYEGVASVIYDNHEPRSTKWQGELYRMLDEANQTGDSVKSYMQAGEMQAARDLMIDNKAQLSLRSRLNSLALQIREVNKQIRLVQQAPGIDGERKQEMIDKLDARRNDIARQVAPYAGMF